MTIKLFLSSLFTALLFGCGQATNTADVALAGVARSVNEVAIASGEPHSFADLTIEGMSCEMMCGGSIKKALASLGVDSTMIVMSRTEGPDHAIVSYDDGKVSDAQMIEAIQKLHEGQYKVIAVAITKQVKGNAANDATGVKTEEEGVSVYAPQEVVLPSVVAILGRLLRY